LRAIVLVIVAFVVASNLKADDIMPLRLIDVMVPVASDEQCFAAHSLAAVRAFFGLKAGDGLPFQYKLVDWGSAEVVLVHDYRWHIKMLEVQASDNNLRLNYQGISSQDSGNTLIVVFYPGTFGHRKIACFDIEIVEQMSQRSSEGSFRTQLESHEPSMREHRDREPHDSAERPPRD
jgi:hypothetical protein